MNGEELLNPNGKSLCTALFPDCVRGLLLPLRSRTTAPSFGSLKIVQRWFSLPRRLSCPISPKMDDSKSLIKLNTSYKRPSKSHARPSLQPFCIKLKNEFLVSKFHNTLSCANSTILHQCTFQQLSTSHIVWSLWPYLAIEMIWRLISAYFVPKCLGSLL